MHVRPRLLIVMRGFLAFWLGKHCAYSYVIFDNLAYQILQLDFALCGNFFQYRHGLFAEIYFNFQFSSRLNRIYLHDLRLVEFKALTL